MSFRIWMGGESNIFYHNYDFLYIQVSDCDSLETE